ncbi:MAG TPA: hypothetical protein VF515_20230 [Candidatus Binatia bacterium]
MAAYHPKADERIEEAFNLCVIHRRQVAVDVGRRHVREHVGDVLLAQQAGQAPDVRRIAEVRNVILCLANIPSAAPLTENRWER